MLDHNFTWPLEDKENNESLIYIEANKNGREQVQVVLRNFDSHSIYVEYRQPEPILPLIPEE